MKRPKPTKQLVIELCGQDGKLIELVHHGLEEVSLRDFYPHLNLDEVVAFGAASWGVKKFRSGSFAGFAESANVYKIFNYVYQNRVQKGKIYYQNIFHWLNTKKKISEELKPKYGQLNPFGKKKNLEERLARVNPAAVERLKRELQEEVNEYVFECQYKEKKRLRDGDNYKLKIMTFQPVYPRSKEKIIANYAAEIVRLISAYPREVDPLEEEKSKKEERWNKEMMEIARKEYPGLEPEEALKKMYPED